MKQLLALLVACISLVACTTPPNTAAGEDTIPGEFVQKTPHLPTTFVDTTGNTYAWTKFYNVVNGLENRIAVPDGYQRESAAEGSFASWLRGIPLKPGRPQVKLFNGNVKGNQTAHHAVIDMDVGTRDLQQCADAVMRLRAEYLFTAKKSKEIHFNFTSGDKCDWERWRQGYRPKISGNKVSWNKTSQASDSHKNFRAYLNMVYNYAGTASLEKELTKVPSVKEVKAGDVFIYGGFPGHAVLVMDVAVNPKTGKKAFLIAQSYMPAQEMHILVNPNDAGMSPWYPSEFAGNLQTPEWTFSQNQLRQF
jgi:hypothetical protein